MGNIKYMVIYDDLARENGDFTSKNDVDFL